MSKLEILDRLNFKIEKLLKLNGLYNLKYLNCKKIYNYKELQDFAKDSENISQKCFELNKQMQQEKISEKLMKGYCSFCNKEREFLIKTMPEFSSDLLFREILYCQKCWSFNRLRALIHIFRSFERNPKNLNIYTYERGTDFFRNLDGKFGKNNKIVGSEYFGPDRLPGEIVDGIRHEDSTNLSFEDNSFNYIFSNDVFEHVQDIQKTLLEVKRCLSKGGRLIANIPCEWNREKTLVRAKITNSKVEYAADKIYHGGFSCDDPNGSLVFYSFGQDIFEIFKQAGFATSYGIAIQDEYFGNIGYEPLVIFVAEK